MPANQASRYGPSSSGEPVLHELAPLRLREELVPVYLLVRCAEDGTWRGRLIFGSGDLDDGAVSTAEIFYGTTEPDLWDAVRDLREHHVRDLHRSLLAE